MRRGSGRGVMGGGAKERRREKKRSLKVPMRINKSRDGAAKEQGAISQIHKNFKFVKLPIQEGADSEKSYDTSSKAVSCLRLPTQDNTAFSKPDSDPCNSSSVNEGSLSNKEGSSLEVRAVLIPKRFKDLRLANEDVEVDHICEPLKPRYWEFGSPKVIGSKVKSAASRRLLIKFNSLRSREMTLPEAIPHVMPSQWQQSDPARHDDKSLLWETRDGCVIVGCSDYGVTTNEENENGSEEALLGTEENVGPSKARGIKVKEKAIRGSRRPIGGFDKATQRSKKKKSDSNTSKCPVQAEVVTPSLPYTMMQIQGRSEIPTNYNHMQMPDYYHVEVTASYSARQIEADPTTKKNRQTDALHVVWLATTLLADGLAVAGQALLLASAFAGSLQGGGDYCPRAVARHRPRRWTDGLPRRWHFGGGVFTSDAAVISTIHKNTINTLAFVFDGEWRGMVSIRIG
uniref:Uncharacterized protein n=2 Tax=Oryza rufipogon TaxID=4529 RepID=A0A0E0MRP8_ORYRU